MIFIQVLTTTKKKKHTNAKNTKQKGLIIKEEKTNESYFIKLTHI